MSCSALGVEPAYSSPPLPTLPQCLHEGSGEEEEEEEEIEGKAEKKILKTLSGAVFH